MVTVPRSAEDRQGTVALLETILYQRPALSEAACVGRYGVFDRMVDYPGNSRPALAARREAAALCAGCAVRGRCPDRVYPRRKPGGHQ